MMFNFVSMYVGFEVKLIDWSKGTKASCKGFFSLNIDNDVSYTELALRLVIEMIIKYIENKQIIIG
ncbi:hypothetical protein Elgi_05560 [Paenibacillus elgii]|nr:hypothetical protein Elgi_05560 [Paenibacillus elgii]